MIECKVFYPENSDPSGTYRSLTLAKSLRCMVVGYEILRTDGTPGGGYVFGVAIVGTLAGGHQSFESLQVYTGGLESNCKEIITDFDTHLEKYRMVLRGLKTAK